MTKAEQIRALAQMTTYTRTEIARLVGTPYSHVHATLNKQTTQTTQTTPKQKGGFTMTTQTTQTTQTKSNQIRFLYHTKNLKPKDITRLLSVSYSHVYNALRNKTQTQQTQQTQQKED